MIRRFRAGGLVDDSRVSYASRPVRSQPDVIEPDRLACGDESAPPPRIPLWMSASTYPACSSARHQRTGLAVCEVAHHRMLAKGVECVGTMLVFAGMNAVAIADDQVGPAAGLPAPGEQVANLSQPGALVGVVEVNDGYPASPAVAEVEPGLEESGAVFFPGPGRTSPSRQTQTGIGSRRHRRWRRSRNDRAIVSARVRRTRTTSRARRPATTPAAPAGALLGWSTSFNPITSAPDPLSKLATRPEIRLIADRLPLVDVVGDDSHDLPSDRRRYCSLLGFQFQLEGILIR